LPYVLTESSIRRRERIKRPEIGGTIRTIFGHRQPARLRRVGRCDRSGFAACPGM
jgi:hypothetical protein